MEGIHKISVNGVCIYQSEEGKKAEENQRVIETMIKRGWTKIMQFNLAEVRKARKWSQGKLALMSGISRSYISEIETGKYEPDYRTICRICKALKCTPNDLINYVD